MNVDNDDIKDFDVVHYWGTNEERFPTLYNSKRCA